MRVQFLYENQKSTRIPRLLDSVKENYNQANELDRHK